MSVTPTSITEKLANMTYTTVIITIVVLLVLRWILYKVAGPARAASASGRQKQEKQDKQAGKRGAARAAEALAEFPLHARAAGWLGEIAEQLAIAMGLVFLIIRPFFVQAFFIPSASMHPTLLEDDHILVNKFVYRFVREPKLGDVVVFKAPIGATPEVEQQIVFDAGDRGLTGRERDECIAREKKNREKDFIKRVIGVPGDKIRITPGYVTIGSAQYGHRDLRDLLSTYARPDGDRSVKLINDHVLVDGRLVNSAEIAASTDSPDAKVKVVPGKVYINGKPLKEPYTAEDPDEPYPGGPRDMVKPGWLFVGKDGVQYVKVPKGKLLVMGDNRNSSNDARFWGLLDRRRVLGKAMFIFWPPGRIKWVR